MNLEFVMVNSSGNEFDCGINSEMRQTSLRAIARRHIQPFCNLNTIECVLHFFENNQQNSAQPYWGKRISWLDSDIGRGFGNGGSARAASNFAAEI